MGTTKKVKYKLQVTIICVFSTHTETIFVRHFIFVIIKIIIIIVLQQSEADNDDDIKLENYR